MKKPIRTGRRCLAARLDWRVTRFINSWADRVLIPGIAPLIVVDILDCLHEKDRAYFRASREKAFGKPLESVSADRETRVADLRRALEPLRFTLRQQPFLGGEAPSYADYIPFGAFQWARCTSGFDLLAADDPINAWIELLMDAFDGLARKARC